MILSSEEVALRKERQEEEESLRDKQPLDQAFNIGGRKSSESYQESHQEGDEDEPMNEDEEENEEELEEDSHED